CRSPSCESCFSKDFCMKCKEHFFLHKGKCFSACPPETLAQSSTRECQGKPEKCETGPWANWSPCTNQGRTCGFKWGTTTRAREAVRSSKEELAMCPTLTESRKCRMKKHCPGEKNEKKRKGKREKKERKKKRKMDSLMAT
ncbi:PREDICTED: R-spondin-4-like, partial [Gekko japonicus]|uniref:R-spondin-4-like n=1 Tax=Gekko japonicus TaxID=146911 RepID=A0ABM1KEL2_GEKJA